MTLSSPVRHVTQPARSGHKQFRVDLPPADAQHSTLGWVAFPPCHQLGNFFGSQFANIMPGIAILSPCAPFGCEFQYRRVCGAFLRKSGRRKSNLRLLSAGELPGSVLTRYDLLGNCVHGRLQDAY